jgi:hypothetical protein
MVAVSEERLRELSEVVLGLLVQTRTDRMADRSRLLEALELVAGVYRENLAELQDRKFWQIVEAF